MAQSCYVCGKGPAAGMKVSHSHRRSKRRWYPNLQSFKANLKGTTRTIAVCTKCIKAGKVVKA